MLARALLLLVLLFPGVAKAGEAIVAEPALAEVAVEVDPAFGVLAAFPVPVVILVLHDHHIAPEFSQTLHLKQKLHLFLMFHAELRR